MSKPTILHASIGRDTYKTTLQTDDHQLIGDEPPSSGGSNLGPDPYEFILAGLATCTAATVRMYADRKAWDLEKIDLSLSLQVEKLSGTQITHIQREIQFFGNLDAEQTQRLLEIADKCPVHRLLTREVQIVTTVSANTAPPKSGNDAADAQPQ